MHGEPEAGWDRGGGQHPVGRVRRQEKIVPGAELDLAFTDLQPGLALKQEHPFVLGLVVKNRIGAVTALDALNPDVAALQECRKRLASGRLGEVLKQALFQHGGAWGVRLNEMERSVIGDQATKNRRLPVSCVA